MAQGRNDEVIAKTREFLEKTNAEDIPQTAFILLMRWAQGKRGIVDGPSFLQACSRFLAEHGEMFRRCPESEMGSMMIDMREDRDAVARGVGLRQRDDH